MTKSAHNNEIIIYHFVQNILPFYLQKHTLHFTPMELDSVDLSTCRES